MTMEPKKFENPKLEEFLRTKILPDENREGLREFFQSQIEKLGDSLDSIVWRMGLMLLEDGDAWRKKATEADAAASRWKEAYDGLRVLTDSTAADFKRKTNTT